MTDQVPGLTHAGDRKIHALRITLIVLCVIFSISILLNMVIVVSSWINPDFPPGMFGMRMILVNSDSMASSTDGSIPMNSVVLVRKRDFESYAEGDVIGMSINRQSLFGRVSVIRQNENGETEYLIKADNMDAYYRDPVTAENYIGEVTRHVNWLGGFTRFQTSTVGLILFEVIPWLICIGIVGYEVRLIVRARRAAKAKEQAEKEKNSK